MGAHVLRPPTGVIGLVVLFVASTAILAIIYGVFDWAPDEGPRLGPLYCFWGCFAYIVAMNVLYRSFIHEGNHKREDSGRHQALRSGGPPPKTPFRGSALGTPFRALACSQIFQEAKPSEALLLQNPGLRRSLNPSGYRL